MRGIKIFIIMILIASTASGSITFHFERNATRLSAYSFENDSFTSPEQADLTFVGMRDKAMGKERPKLYTDNMHGRIVPARNRCSEAEYSEMREADLIVEEEYCIRTMSGNSTVRIKILDLSAGWKNMTLSVIDEHFGSHTEMNVSSADEDPTTKNGTEEMTAGEQADGTESILNRINPFWIFVDILVIILIIIALRRILDEKGSGIS